MNRIFVDMDGVIVDYMAYCEASRMTPEEVNQAPDSFANMLPFPGAIDAVRELAGLGYDVFIASKPQWDAPHSYADKVRWIQQWMPEFAKKVIFTQNKGLLGDDRDFVVDDRPHKCKLKHFKGIVLHFIPGSYEWDHVLQFFRTDRQYNLTFKK